MISSTYSPPVDIASKRNDQLMAPVKDLAKEKPKIVLSPEKSRQLYDNAQTEEEKKAKKVAGEFVSILFNMLFKQMEATVEKTGFLDGGKGEEMFRSFVTEEYSKMASSQTSFALTHRVYENLYDSMSKRVTPKADGKPIEAIG